MEEQREHDEGRTQPEEAAGSAEPTEEKAQPEGGPPLYEHERHEPTAVDAMGLDKHRQVTGKVYGPTKAQIFTRFAIFFAVLGLLAAGAVIAVKELDQPPKENPPEARWSDPDAPQRPPKPLQ